MGTATREKSVAVSFKPTRQKMHVPYDPAIAFLGVDLRNSLFSPQTWHTNAHSSLFHTSQTWTQPSCPLRSERSNCGTSTPRKSQQFRNRLSTRAPARMNLQEILLSQKRPSPKDACCTIPSCDLGGAHWWGRGSLQEGNPRGLAGLVPPRIVWCGAQGWTWIRPHRAPRVHTLTPSRTNSVIQCHVFGFDITP